MQVKQYPFFIKSTVILFGIILLTYSLINLRDILVPIAFAVIISILLNPLVNRFKRSGISKVFSIIIAMLIALTVFCGILYFLSSQMIGFGDNLPLLKSKFGSLLNDLQQWLKVKFGLAIDKQVQLLNEALNNSKAVLGKTVGTALGTLAVVFLLPVYVFLLLFYKTLILNFLYEVFFRRKYFPGRCYSKPDKNSHSKLHGRSVARSSYCSGFKLNSTINFRC